MKKNLPFGPDADGISFNNKQMPGGLTMFE